MQENRLCDKCLYKNDCSIVSVLGGDECFGFKANSSVWVKPNKSGSIVLKNETKTTRIIQNGKATILFWDDGTKTIVKCSNDDKYNAEYGFLIAYFEKNSGMTKSKIQKYFKENLHKEAK